MLRLKGERDEMALEMDEPEERPLPPRGLPTADAALAEELPEGGAADTEDEDLEPEDGPSPLADLLPLRGLAIAGATFVPTFLAVFLGVPYLMGPASTARTPGGNVTVTAPLGPDTGAELRATLSEALRGGSLDRPGEPRTAPRPADETAQPESPKRDLSGREGNTEAVAPRVAEPAPSTPTPEAVQLPPLPPVASRPAERPRAPEPAAAPTTPAPPAKAPVVEPAPQLPATQRPAVARSIPEARPTSAESRGSEEWTPAAAFADREAAGRLASSIRQQGYPVDIRQDGSSSRPWVVWIGARPGSSRRR